MRTWSTPVGIIIEGVQTGDGRLIVEGATDWMELPLPFIPVHGSDESIGNVTSIERKGQYIVATGTLDDATETGAQMVRQMDEGVAPMGTRWGVSIEPDDYAFEIVDTTIVEADAEPPPDGEESLTVVLASYVGRGVLPERSRNGLIWDAFRAAAGDGEPDGVVVYEDAQDNIIERVTRLRIRALAGTTTPAFADAYIELDPVAVSVPGTPPPTVTPEPVVAAFAAAAAIKFPRSAFTVDEPDYVTALTVLDDGTWFGHVHEDGACHIGYPGRCVTAPPSPSGYEFFNRTGGIVDCDDGVSLRVAAFMLDINHAPLNATVGQVQTHYDPYANTECVWGFGRVREGKHGPFACGVLRPDLTAGRLTLLKACGQVSGDWRDGELYACQAVPRPGLPIERHDLVASARACDCDGGHEIPIATMMLTELYEEAIAKPRRFARYERARERIRGR